ncbi:hypothetical protein [Sphingobium lignivorans]|uniref:Lipoprotein n=1 Tax=Sphingobium lignivorans TaxID=2735886 RepID=A0ABR6NLV9_9SPHN|nr:hypothetical protein [Sphingobium lignivorans]MBB5987189.1 hypothetical protein [Sphingobium lignivorans]
MPIPASPIAARSRRAAVALAPLCALLALSACATPEAQLRQGLVNAGLSEPMARCMARPMVEKLSTSQLMKLRSLGKTGDLDPRRTSYNELMRHLRAMQDPEIIRVTASAALGCSLG